VGPDLRLRGILERARISSVRRMRIPRARRVFPPHTPDAPRRGTLHEMNDTDVSPGTSPNSGPLSLFPAQVYHYYTADEHTLIAIANAENLRDKQGILREVFRNLPRKDVLYAAVLASRHREAPRRGDHEIRVSACPPPY